MKWARLIPLQRSHTSDIPLGGVNRPSADSKVCEPAAAAESTAIILKLTSQIKIGLRICSIYVTGSTFNMCRGNPTLPDHPKERGNFHSFDWIMGNPRK